MVGLVNGGRTNPVGYASGHDWPPNKRFLSHFSKKTEY